MDSKIRLGLVVLVGVGWLFNLVAPAFAPTYDSNLAANGPLLLILGSLFVAPKRKGKDDENG